MHLKAKELPEIREGETVSPWTLGRRIKEGPPPAPPPVVVGIEKEIAELKEMRKKIDEMRKQREEIARSYSEQIAEAEQAAEAQTRKVVELINGIDNLIVCSIKNE